MNDPTKRSHMRPEIEPRWDQYRWAVRYTSNTSAGDFALFTNSMDANTFCEIVNAESGDATYEVAKVKK